VNTSYPSFALTSWSHGGDIRPGSLARMGDKNKTRKPGSATLFLCNAIARGAFCGVFLGQGLAPFSFAISHGDFSRHDLLWKVAQLYWRPVIM
jgi:hypothetical protein